LGRGRSQFQGSLGTQSKAAWANSPRQPGQIVQETLFRKSPSPKRAGKVAQGVGPEFKCHTKKKKKTQETQ
jgi:hypothetical protein